MTNHSVVSFDDEKLVLVDENDRVLGYENKDVCHNGDGVLHRAFSIFIFNTANELLLQKRNGGKRLWGGFWSNTCCSHPRKGETFEIATARRLKEEIGLSALMTYLYKFQYQARFSHLGSENELCYVYIGKTDQPPTANENEIEDWKYISFDDLNSTLNNNPHEFTPWFKMEWKILQEKYREQIMQLKT